MTRSDGSAQDKRWRLLILGSCLLLFLFSNLYGFLKGSGDSLQNWSGYYTLVLDSRVDLARVDNALVAAGFPHPISSLSARTDMSGFGAPQYYGLQDLGARLGNEDPRLDDWIRNLPRFFTDRDGSRQIVYIASDEAIAPVMVRIASALRPLSVNWVVLEWKPVIRLALYISAFLIAGIVVGFSRKRRVMLALSALPWITLAVSGGFGLFAVNCAIFIAWSLVLETLVPALKRFSHDVPNAPFFWDHPGDGHYVANSLALLRPYVDRGVLRARIVILSALVILSAAMAVAKRMPEFLPELLLVSVLVWPSLLILLGRLYQVRHRRSEHQLFAPIPILTRGKVFHTGMRVALIPILVLGIGLPLFSTFIPGAGVLPEIAAPGKASPVRYTDVYDHFQRSFAPDPELPPDSFEYVRHRAFQASLPFIKDHNAADFKMPAPGQTLGLTGYEVDGNKVIPSTKTELRFDDTWLRGILSKLPSDSVERILADQGALSTLVFSKGGALYSADAWSLVAAASLLGLCLPLLLLGKNSGVRQFYGTKRILSLNRKVAA